ncbi:MAG TPA: nucleotidyltransferase family protein [Terracidiphilus sp.]|jgi:dTDP-glucose pyrophosphorylase/CBS domain-containing protein
MMTTTTIEARLESVIAGPAISIGEAIARLDRAGTGALAICSDDHKLIGVLTDGDIRRAVLKSRTLDDPCVSIATQKPIVGLHSITSAEALRVMTRHEINHLPVLDADGVLVDFILRRDLGSNTEVEATTELRLRDVVISPTTSIAEAIALLDKAGTGALVLCTGERVLCGVLTDGDIRRAILQRKPMESPCEFIATSKPTVAPPGLSPAELLDLMSRHEIDHLPVVDTENRVVQFLLRKDLIPEVHLDLSAVIMAGGFGKRLYPLTETVPKPMLPVGDRPLLELIIQQLRRSGIHDVNLTTHYLPESIMNHFGNGDNFGVRLNYCREDHPMGTAGGLKQMKRPDGPFLVINGDILTAVPFREMLTYHRRHQAVMTVGVRKYDVQVPFGVVECEDVRVTSIQEKPSLNFFINAGTYLLEPSAWDYIPEGQRFDMTDLIRTLLEAEQRVTSFPIMEYWIDVGRHEDYQRAQDDVLKGTIAT